MPDQAAALRDWLRDHVRQCEGCDAEWAVYCPRVSQIAERFYLLRRRQVLVEREIRLAGARR